MRRIILLASLLAVTQLAGSSILERFQQRSVKTAKTCLDVGGSLGEELRIADHNLVVKCELPDFGFGKYLDYDILDDQLTCKQNAPGRCKASVREYGKVLDKIWRTVSDPSVCEDYEFLKTFVMSCN